MNKTISSAHTYLFNEPSHPLVKMALEYDCLEYDTLVKYKVGLMKAWNKDWLVFPYNTGAQLYRRENNQKIIRAIPGSNPSESLFGIESMSNSSKLIIAKSPRETMLLNQILGEEYLVAGLTSGEVGTLTTSQKKYLEVRVPGIHKIIVLLDRDTDNSKSLSNMLTEDINHSTNKETLVADVTKFSNGQFKDITEALREENNIDYVQQILADAKSINNITSLNNVTLLHNTDSVNPLKSIKYPGQFSEGVYNSLPTKIGHICSHLPTNKEKDIFLMALLPVLASHLTKTYINNVDGLISPDLYSMIVAPAASGKGIASKAKQLGLRLSDHIGLLSKQEIELWESQKLTEHVLPKPKHKSLFLPANASARSIYDLLEANRSKGVIFESEIDTMLIALSQDWGNFSDLTRKAFHHETISLSRKGELLEVKNPELSIFLSGTFDQFKSMFRNTENGLYSRFALYTFDSECKWKSQRPTHDSNQLHIEIDQMSEWLLNLYKCLNDLEEPFYIRLADHQWDRMDSYFEEKMSSLESQSLADNLHATVKRNGVILQRIATILTVIRAYDELGDELFKRPTITIEDVDFNTALSLVDTLQNHAFFLFDKVLNQSSTVSPFKDIREENFYFQLPDLFKTKEALQVGAKYQIPEATVKRYLNKFTAADNLVKIGHGEYAKEIANTA